MARGKAPTRSGVSRNGAMTAAGAVNQKRRVNRPNEDRNQIAAEWQTEVYRQVNICGEARYAATLYAAMAGRAEIGISEPNTSVGKVKWANEGDEVEALAELAPNVRARSRLIRSYMTHRIIAGECYLIARPLVPTDTDYTEPPEGFNDWESYIRSQVIDPLDPDADETVVTEDPNRSNPIWEIVAVTELRKTGDTWSVRGENGIYHNLRESDPVIRIWVPDPANRHEAWSPFRSLLPTLQEIEWLTRHVFAQVRSRLMSAGVWFVPDNLTFPPPPPDAIQGGETAIAAMNEAEQFMAMLTASGMAMLDEDEVSMPTVVMADPDALDKIDASKMIKFWSEIDDKAMTLRSDAVRRFALGIDLPPEQVLGSSGIAVSGSSGSNGSVNHWGVWANEEQTISEHIEPALDDFVDALTSNFLALACPGTTKVVGYDTSNLRLRQDRSKEAIELYNLGALNAKTMLRENGFDPENDKMDDKEFQRWLLMKLAASQGTPEQLQAAVQELGVSLPTLALPEAGSTRDTTRDTTQGKPGRNEDPSLDDHPYEGPPREDHDHKPAPFSATEAAAEVLVLRALEKAGTRLLNDGKRGKDKDRTTPKHLAHITASAEQVAQMPEWDFMLAASVLPDMKAVDRHGLELKMARLCNSLYRDQSPYTRDALLAALREDA